MDEALLGPYLFLCLKLITQHLPNPNHTDPKLLISKSVLVFPVFIVWCDPVSSE